MILNGQVGPTALLKRGNAHMASDQEISIGMIKIIIIRTEDGVYCQMVVTIETRQSSTAVGVMAITITQFHYLQPSHSSSIATVLTVNV